MARKRRHEITPERMVAFLEALSKANSVTEAAKIADISRSQIYKIRDGDKEFAKAWDDAYAAGTDALEKVARLRATSGKKPSDILLMFLMKKRDPSYRESFKHEVGGPDGGPIPLQFIELRAVEPK